MTPRFWRKKINRRILSGHQGLVVWWSIGPRQTSSRSVTNEQIDWMLKGKMWRSASASNSGSTSSRLLYSRATNMSKGLTACSTNCTGADRVLARTEHRTCPERC
jgi:hypothetical protein